MTVWDITALERDPENGHVSVVHWRASREVDGVLAGTYGAVELPPPPTGNDAPVFVPFEQLTKDQVLQWAVEALSSSVGGEPTPMQEIEAYLDARIAEQQSPPTITGNPW